MTCLCSRRVLSYLEHPHWIAQLVVLLLLALVFREWRAERPTPRPVLRLSMLVAAGVACVVATGTFIGFYEETEISGAIRVALHAGAFVTFGLFLEVCLDTRRDDFARATGRLAATASPAPSADDRPVPARDRTRHRDRSASRSASGSEHA